MNVKVIVGAVAAALFALTGFVAMGEADYRFDLSFAWLGLALAAFSLMLALPARSERS